jgi:hypothetical protein
MSDDIPTRPSPAIASQYHDPVDCGFRWRTYGFRNVQVLLVSLISDTCRGDWRPYTQPWKRGKVVTVMTWIQLRNGNSIAKWPTLSASEYILRAKQLALYPKRLFVGSHDQLLIRFLAELLLENQLYRGNCNVSATCD